MKIQRSVFSRCSALILLVMTIILVAVTSDFGNLMIRILMIEALVAICAIPIGALTLLNLSLIAIRWIFNHMH